MKGPHGYTTYRISLLQGLGWWFACALALILSLSALASSVQAQEAPPKRVLLISTGSRLAPGFRMVDQQLLQAFGQLQSPLIEIYAENLDVARFPAERYRRIFTEYLAEKYAKYPPDLVILVFVANLGIPAKVLTQLFPGTPIIVAGLTEEELRPDQFGPLVSGIAQRVDPGGTLKLILRLQPELRRVVVIGGTAESDREVLQRVKEVAQSFQGRIEIEFWDNLRMADLRQAVTALPPETAILYTRMFRDAAGQALVSAEVGKLIGELANAPVYVLSDSIVGTGAVGGSVASIEAFGKRAGELASLILTGTAPGSVPFEIRSDGVPMFDWRALKRWGISESRLPPDSVVRYRPQSIWEQYYGYIIGALILIFMQSAMIVALILQRRRRRRVQAELQESQQLMELAAGAGELGLWSRDLTAGTLWANVPVRSLFGFGAHDALRFEDLFTRVHPDDRARVISEVERTQAAGLPFEAEFRIPLPDGTQRWVLAKGRAVAGLPGSVACRMGVVLDITGRKQAEEAMDKQRVFLRQVIDVDPNFVFAKDRNGRFTLANQAVADAYGVTVDDLIGKTDADFNANLKEVEFFRRTDLEVMDTLQERFIPEERITDAHGNVRWLQTVKRPLIGSDGLAHQLLGASTDITQRKKTEMELQEQRAELAHGARVSVMGELAASLAHELSQPLTAILSNAKACLRFMNHDPVNMTEVREGLEDIVEANSRAVEIIRGMRALVRKEEELEFTTLDLVSVISDVARLVHGDANMRGVRLSLDLDGALLSVQGDRVQLQQVMLNILLNAFAAVKECPTGERDVKVRAECPDGMIRIAVSDCGPGLRGDELDKIFQPFYTTKPDGLGMGLSICRSIINRHGGRLWAENNPDRGATFYFTVPRRASNARTAQ